MFAKGNILGIISSNPTIEYVSTEFDQNRKKTKLTVSCFKRKYKEPGYIEDDFNLICWGDLPGIDFYTLKKGDMVYVEFKLVRNNYKTEQGNTAHVTRFHLTSLTKLQSLNLSDFRNSSEQTETSDNLYDGNKEKEEDAEVKMEDIF